MYFDYSKVHFNIGLLVKELVKRGISVKLQEGTDVIFAEYNGHREIIQNENTSAIPYTLKYVLDDKYLSKVLLSDLGFSVVPGNIFKKADLGNAALYAMKIGFPVVLKPTIGSHGEEVHMDINNINEFEIAFNSVAKYCETDGFLKILVEKQYNDAKEFRIFISKNNFVAVVEREPASVIGNGKDSLQILIDKENFKRMNPRNSCLCEIRTKDLIFEKFMKDKNLTLDYIPKDGEKVYLRPNSNVSTGANCRNVTDKVHPSVIEIAKNMIGSVKGLPYVGIDFLTQKNIWDYHGENDYVICELNTTPGFSLHTHEETLTPINVPGEVVDIIFPETKFGESFFIPKSIEVELTTACNLKCKDCGILPDLYDPKTLDEKLLVSELNKIDIDGYALTGGEPLLLLDKVCYVLENCNKDLIKLQSNGLVFSSLEKTKEIFDKLKLVGLGKYKKIKPSIVCSFGLQSENGVSYENVCNFLYVTTKEFKDNGVVRLNLTVKDEQEAQEHIVKLEEKYFDIFGERLDYNSFIINVLYIFDIRHENSNFSKLSIEEVLEKYKDWDCRSYMYKGNEYMWDSPYPRILLRSNGEIYSCLGFEHVIGIGNLMKDGFEGSVRNANNNKYLKLVMEDGLKGIYELLLKTDPKLRDLEFYESNASCAICEVCKILYAKYQTLGSEFQSLK